MPHAVALLVALSAAALVAAHSHGSHAIVCSHARTGILRRVASDCCPENWHEFPIPCDCAAPTTTTTITTTTTTTATTTTTGE